MLLLTVLIVNRVAHIRQLRNQSRAIGAQSAVILAQAVRARDALTSAKSEDDRAQAEARLSDGIGQLRQDAAPLLAVLNPQQRSALSSDDAES